MGANGLARVGEHEGFAEIVGLRFADGDFGAVPWMLKASSPWSLPSGTTLETLAEAWLDAMRGQLDPDTVGLYRLHLTRHLLPHFRSPENITKATIGEYGRLRLRVVKSATVRKERSTFRGFLGWCHEQGYLRELPESPDLPRRATGTAFSKRRRGKATEMTPDECRALIAALPEWAVSKRTGRFPVRARFQFMFETSLRPATLDALSVPQHYTRGAETLRISDEDDKARFGRDVPLSAEARAALDAVCPESGPIFGKHDYRYQLRGAARLVLAPTKAQTFCAYDLRHARLTQLSETGNLPGVAYIAGHKRVTTTSIYVKPGPRAAKAVLGVSSAGHGSERMVRNVAELSPAALRLLPPPSGDGQAQAEWQVAINALADAREAAAKAALPNPVRQRRASPRADAALDDLVVATIAAREFSSQHELRAQVGCSLARLRGSLERLTRAGRIVQVRKSGKDWPPVWRVVGVKARQAASESTPDTPPGQTAASPR